MLNVKSYLLSVIVVLVSSFANFMVFLEAYKRLSFPFINEEQRVENAPYIFLYVLPCFIIISAFAFLLYKLVSRTQKKS